MTVWLDAGAYLSRAMPETLSARRSGSLLQRAERA
jgi:hypothetical protein